ncbi:MAG: hypothetical protein ACP5VE_14905 [Chthonomonadales bacterium]
MTSDATTRCVVYVRVSIEGQATEGTSLETQDAARVAELRQRLDALTQKEAKAVSLRLEEGISAEAMAEVIAAIRKERKAVEQELADLTGPKKQKPNVPQISPQEAQEAIFRAMRTAAATLKSDTVSIAEKRAVLAFMLERLDVKNGEVTATFTVPFAETVRKVPNLQSACSYTLKRGWGSAPANG